MGAGCKRPEETDRARQVSRAMRRGLREGLSGSIGSFLDRQKEWSELRWEGLTEGGAKRQGEKGLAELKDGKRK